MCVKYLFSLRFKTFVSLQAKRNFPARTPFEIWSSLHERFHRYISCHHSLLTQRYFSKIILISQNYSIPPISPTQATHMESKVIPMRKDGHC